MTGVEVPQAAGLVNFRFLTKSLAEHENFKTSEYLEVVNLIMKLADLKILAWPAIANGLP